MTEAETRALALGVKESLRKAMEVEGVDDSFEDVAREMTRQLNLRFRYSNAPEITALIRALEVF